MSRTPQEHKVLKKINDEQKEDSYYGKNSHGRSLDDLDMFEAELNKKVVVQNNYIAYERDDFGGEFSAPAMVKTLPEAVAQRLDSMEDLCFYGILSLDVHPLAWVSVDDSVCLWIPPLTLAQPPPTRVVHFRDYVTAVAILRSDPDKAYACDGVPPYFLAVALRDCVQLMQLYLTDTELVVRETGIEVAVDSFVCKMVATDNGRLFIGCKDGLVYEIDAEADDSLGSLFYPRKSRKTNCSKSGGLSAIWTVVKDVASHAFRGPKSQDPVSFLVYDPSRHIILALTQARSVVSGGGQGGSSNAQLHAFFLESRGPNGESLCQRNPVTYRGPFALESESHIIGMDSSVREYHLEEIIALHPISKDECSRLNAVLVSSTGCRFYISVTEQDGFSCRAVRPPPTVEQGGWALSNAKSAKVTASAYQDGLWLATCADRSRAGGLFCVSQDRNMPPRLLGTSSSGQPQQRKVEVVSAFPAAAVQMLPASVWALQEVSPSFWYCSPAMYAGIDGSGRMLTSHELFGQHVVQHRRFLLLCRNGIFLVSRRQPWEKLDYSLSRCPELLASPDKLSKALRMPKEQLCATAVLWWVRSGVSVDDGLSSSRAFSTNGFNEAQGRSLQLFSFCEKQEPGRAGLGLLIALSRFLRPVWSSASVASARDWARVSGELELVKRFVELCGNFEVYLRSAPIAVSDSKDVIKQMEVLEIVSHCQQLCALLHLVVKGGGCLQPGGLGKLAQNYLEYMRSGGTDPILDLVRSVSEASCSKAPPTGNKKGRWSYDDAPGFRENLLLTRAEQEQLDHLLTRLLPPSKLAQARADKELSRARALHSANETEGIRECVRKAQDQLMGISRDLSLNDLKRYAGRGTQDSPSTSFGYVKQPLPFIQIVLHRFANQSLVSIEEVHLLWDFIQDMFREPEESGKSEEELDVALQLLIQHAGLYRNANQQVSGGLERSTASGMASIYGQRNGGVAGLMQGSSVDDREERAMWPLLRGMLEPHWRAYVDERERSNGHYGMQQAEQTVSPIFWSKMVNLVGRRYLESSQAGAKALLEFENFMRSPTTVQWLNERGPKDAQRSWLAERFVSHCQAGLLHAAGLYAKAGHVCYLRAKQAGDVRVEDRIEALVEAKKAALLNGGNLPQAQVSAASLELEAALAQLQLQLQRRSSDPAAEERFGRGLMDMKSLFEAACGEELFDLALDICALSIPQSELPPAQVVETLWRNMLLKAFEERNVEHVLRMQGRKYVKREGFFPLVHIISLLEDHILPHTQEPSNLAPSPHSPNASVVGLQQDAGGVLEEVGVEPLRLVQAYMERLDGRLDEAAQERCLIVVSRVYMQLLQRALESGTEGLLPVVTMDNDLVRLQTHPSLRRLRGHLEPPRALLDRLRARLAPARL